MYSGQFLFPENYLPEEKRYKQYFQCQYKTSHHLRQQKNAQDVKENISSLLSFLSSSNLSYPGTCPKPFLYCFCPVIPKVPPTMFIILSHTCSRISYITDCTLKKDNNQVNPLLPRHIPAEASDIHHISRVHSDYRIGRSVLHALRYGSCHFQLL